jgi:hypothetical protein
MYGLNISFSACYQVFQSDPFVYLEKELSEGSTTDLWLSGEHMPYKKIKNCVFNTGWIRDCYGKVRMLD